MMSPRSRCSWLGGFRLWLVTLVLDRGRSERQRQVRRMLARCSVLLGLCERETNKQMLTTKERIVQARLVLK